MESDADTNVTAGADSKDFLLNPKNSHLLPPSNSNLASSTTSLASDASITTNDKDSKSNKSIFKALVNLYNSRKSKDGKLGIATAFFIMISMSYGTSVIIMPYVIKKLGWFIFSVSITGSFIVLAFCAVLLKESCVHVMMEHKGRVKDDAISREPYPIVAELTVGKRFAFVLETTMFVALIANIMAYLLLGATCMNRVLPLGFTYYNRIRVWLMIEFFAVLPFMMIGTYNDLNIPAFTAVFTSSVATLCIFSIAAVAGVNYGSMASQYVVVPVDGKPAPVAMYESSKFFKLFGEILFAAAGPALLLPNVIVLLRKPARFRSPILTIHIFLLCLYVFLAVIPYSVFGQKVQPSIMDTLNDAIFSLSMSSYWLLVVTLAEIALVLHFAMASVLCANPVFLNLEEKLSFPTNKSNLFLYCAHKSFGIGMELNKQNFKKKSY